MAYLLRRAGSQNTWPCKAAGDIDFMLLFCYPKLYEGRYCGQKGIVLAYIRRWISICYRLEPLYLARNRLPVKRSNDDSKQKPPLITGTEVGQQPNWVWKEAQSTAVLYNPPHTNTLTLWWLQNIKFFSFILPNCGFVTVMNHKQISVFSNGFRWPLQNGHLTFKGVITHKLRPTCLSHVHSERLKKILDLCLFALTWENES